MNPDSRERWVCRAMLAVALLAFSMRSVLFLGAGTDDMFFSLWSGEQVAASHGLINYNGEPQEISSSILHVLVIALISLLAPRHVYSLNKLFGFSAGIGVFIVIHLIRKDLFPSQRYRTSTYALTLSALVFENNFLYWCLGGLETPLATLVLVTYGALLVRHWRKPTGATLAGIALSQCAYIMTRPEGFYLLPLTLIFLLLSTRYAKLTPRMWLAIAVPCFLLLVLTAWRWLSFGLLFPNPVYAKTGELSPALRDGGLYLLDYFSASYFRLFECVVMLGLTVRFTVKLAKDIVNRKSRPSPDGLEQAFLYGLSVTVLAFVLFSGGDWMGASRFVVPAMPALALLAISMPMGIAARLTETSGGLRFRRSIPAIVRVLLIALIWTNASHIGFDVFWATGLKKLPTLESDPTVHNLAFVFSSWKDLDERFINMNPSHRLEIDRTRPILDWVLPELHAKRNHIVIVVGNAGIFPYMVKKQHPDWDLYFIDLHGLATKEIATMGLGRNIGGAKGGNLAHIFRDTDSPLSKFVRGHNPDIIYVVTINERERRAVERAGFVVLNRSGHMSIAYRPVR